MANSDALRAFIEEKQQIEILLEKLSDHVQNHFGFDPDAINWAHTETLERYRRALDNLLDQIELKGEYEQA